MAPFLGFKNTSFDVHRPNHLAHSTGLRTSFGWGVFDKPFENAEGDSISFSRDVFSLGAGRKKVEKDAGMLV
jgi:hypothetical protein